MAGESAKNMADLIRAVVDDELKKRDQIALCRVRCVNDDGTVDVYDVGDETQSFSKIPNNSGVFLASGDYVYVVKVGGTYSTAYVSRRLATLANTPESPQGQLDNLFAKSKGVDKRLSNLSSYYVKKNNLVDLVYPVGSVYYTTDFDFDPQKAFGGKWKRWSEVYVQGDGITNTGFYENQQKNVPCKIVEDSVGVEDENGEIKAVDGVTVSNSGDSITFNEEVPFPLTLECHFTTADGTLFCGDYLFWFQTSLSTTDLAKLIESVEVSPATLRSVYNDIFPITSIKVPFFTESPQSSYEAKINFNEGAPVGYKWTLKFYMVRWPLAYYRVK